MDTEGLYVRYPESHVTEHRPFSGAWIFCRQRKEALAPADEEEDEISRERRMKGIAEISTLHPYSDLHQEPVFQGQLLLKTQAGCEQSDAWSNVGKLCWLLGPVSKQFVVVAM
ncbi:hypothetical protein ASPBRDRAFT_39751 [Aspergillus brasiliensis CBS 101740]|uniref:Uncharacterized protein n=1 Tax=Aspergillus brasiliensis (strain CBS 101740 / IMI 381727 / IBT 21946) TaxID=767769 RepID=A0A1L9USJ5_ASPBC|nr:hypothetical protein ASPBRDRAFT_39751 [Aspergillus brasiliensis CBS 101740]